MFQFPGEDERVAAVSQAFSSKLFYVDAFCTAWYDALSEKWFSGHSPKVRDLIVRLVMQALRQFRSINEECRRAEGFCGDIVARSLFETTVAVGFMLKPGIKLELIPLLDKQTKLPKKTDKGVVKHRAAQCANPAVSFPPEFRVKLYHAHNAFSTLAILEELAVVKGVAVHSGPESPALLLARADAAEQEKEIGDEWSFVIKEAGWYSGLTLENTTALVCPHLLDIYGVIYKSQSGKGHAAGALNLHDWFSDDFEIHMALRVGAMLVLFCINMLQTYLGLGEGVALALDPWREQFHAVFDSE